jgi:hypothetical protein
VAPRSISAPQAILNKTHDESFGIRERLVAGALGGIAATACTYPLDLVRTRLTIQCSNQERYAGVRLALAFLAASRCTVYF